MKRKLLTGLSAVLAVFALSWLAAPRSEAGRGLWPAKKGELCWLDDEGNTVRASITRMDGDHYLFHGAVLRASDPPPFDVHPFSGNVELEGELAIGHAVQSQLNDLGEPDEVVEAYSGIFWIDITTLEGTAEGVTYRCSREPAPNMDCELLNNGPSALIPIACP